MSTLRLVKVVVQPTYVVDDGEQLEEMQGEPQVVNARDWPDFPSELERKRAVTEQQLRGD